MKRKTLLATITLLAVSGCASVQPPSRAEMAALPMVEIGSGKPPTEGYVLHIPADHPFPVKLVIDGQMLKKRSAADTQVSLRRDVYLYKHWLSYDSKTWIRSDQEVDFVVNVGLDGDGGTVSLAVN